MLKPLMTKLGLVSLGAILPLVTLGGVALSQQRILAPRINSPWQQRIDLAPRMKSLESQNFQLRQQVNQLETQNRVNQSSCR